MGRHMSDVADTARIDLIVIGSGPAGEKAAAQAAYFGKRVIVIEREAAPGGAAVHTGTLPSKTLREAGLFLSGHQQRELYGVAVQLDPTQAVPRLLSRKDAVRLVEVARIRDNLARHRVELVQGAARVVDQHTVEATTVQGTRRLSAEFLLVATGSRPHRPADIDFENPAIHDADQILQLDRLPRSLAILGAGVIGCEYATMFAAMGTAVTLVDPHETILPFLDVDVVERLRAAMASLGITFRGGSPWTSVHPTSNTVTTTLADGSAVVSEQLLFSAGRQGNIDGLGLEALGVEVDKRGHVVVDSNFRTAVPSIYAAGDVIGFPALASTSMEQGRVAVCHAFGFPYKQRVSELLPYGVYTIPEVSSVGLAETEARAKGHDVVVGRASFRDNARGAIVGDREGLLKLVFDRRTRRVLGCHCVGERAAELVHVGQAVMLLDGTVETFIEMVFNFPTLTELYKYAAYDALGRW
jgi:NAD(P) transhydrogenase